MNFYILAQDTAGLPYKDPLAVILKHNPPSHPVVSASGTFLVCTPVEIKLPPGMIIVHGPVTWEMT